MSVLAPAAIVVSAIVAAVFAVRAPFLSLLGVASRAPEDREPKGDDLGPRPDELPDEERP